MPASAHQVYCCFQALSPVLRLSFAWGAPSLDGVFLNLSGVDILGGIILCRGASGGGKWGCHSMDGSMFSSLPGLPSFVKPKMSPDIARCSQGGVCVCVGVCVHICVHAESSLMRLKATV